MNEEQSALKLQRDGKLLNQQDYIKTSESMLKMQAIIEKLVDNTPDIQRFIPQESILKPQKQKYKQNQNNQDPTRQDIMRLIKPEITVTDCSKHVKEIEAKLQEIKLENQNLRETLYQKKDTFVKRELEYRKIIQKLQDEIREGALLNINDSTKMEEAAITHQEILNCISNIQRQTSKILVDQESDILRFFNNKINEIKKQFEEERIKKGKKDQDYIEKENQLIHELDWIKNIAQKIDNENHNLQKKYVDLKAQYQTQENDRQMLLKELIMLKKKNAVLKSQIDKFEKQIHDISNDDIKDDYAYQSQQARLKFGDESNKSNKIQSGKKLFLEQNTIQNNSSANKLWKTEQEIQNVQMLLRKEQKNVRELKSLYMTQLENKQTIERIMRKCIDDIKEEIIQLKGENRIKMKNQDEEEQLRIKQDRKIEILLTNEKTLTLIYDKTFYSETKNIDNKVMDSLQYLNEENTMYNV